MKHIQINDFVGISFLIISIALAATTGFLVIERRSMKKKWKLPITVSSLVTGIASAHYFYMRNKWITEGSNPVIYRYMDWFLTVPLLIIEFYLVAEETWMKKERKLSNLGKQNSFSRN